LRTVPEAFHFYRFCLMEYLERILGLSPWNVTVRSELMRARLRDRSGFENFEERAWDASDRFATQRINAVRRYATHLMVLNEGRPEQAMQQLLSTYTDLYEIEYSLWYLGVLAGAITTGKFRPGAFGGTQDEERAGRSDRASREVPPRDPFRGSFQPVLRRGPPARREPQLLPAADKPGIARRRGSRNGDSLGCSGSQHPSSQLTAVGPSCRHLSWIRSRDMASQAAAAVSRSRPHLHRGEHHGGGRRRIHPLQLWCFRDIDPVGEWLDEATLQFVPRPGGWSGSG
jgi:hypothetical protein